MTTLGLSNFQNCNWKNSNIDVYLCIWLAVDKFPNLKVSNTRPEIIVSGAQDVRITRNAVYKKKLSKDMITNQS